jgi:hypothetical protein
MSKYLVSIYQPQGDPPPKEVLDPIMEQVSALDREMQDAGCWVFGGGLDYPSTATVVSTSDSGELLLTDGPFVELKEYLGGLSVIDVADLDAALGYAQRLEQIIGLPIEVRPFYHES